MFKVLASIFGLSVILALLIPPQVKTVQFKYDSTYVEFWYPTFVQTRSGIEFRDNLEVKESETATDWSSDDLRATKFICTKDLCQSAFNPIAREWQKNEVRLGEVKKELTGYQLELTTAQNNFANAKRYLIENSCDSISAGPSKPSFACAPFEEADIALVTCSIRELGAKACEKLGKNAVDIEAPKFFKDVIAREGCGAVATEILGEEYNPLDKTIKKYTIDLPLTVISEFLGLFWKDGKEGFDWLVSAAKTSQCIPSGVELCRGKYTEWQALTEAHLAKYSGQMKVCAQVVEKIKIIESEISITQTHIAAARSLTTSLSATKAEIERKVEVTEVRHAIGLL
jgi:hypothetical protein